jgi:hypothetical protein
VILDELAGEFAPGSGARQKQIENLAAWGRLMGSSARVVAVADSVRVRPTAAELQVDAFTRVENVSDRPINGRWTIAELSSWRIARDATVVVEPTGQRATTVSLLTSGLEPRSDGIHAIPLRLDVTGIGAINVSARLALATCAQLPRRPTIDGRFDDWPLASSNSLGDFRLAPGAADPEGARPVLPTQVFVGLHGDELFLAARCTLLPGESPVARADNQIPMEGPRPWGQDVLEVLLAPTAIPGASQAELHVLQIKPNGVLVGRRGYLTDPPISKTEPWPAGARTAVTVQDNVWNVEMAIPLAAFAAEGRRAPVWGFNVARMDMRRGEYSSWSGARTPWSGTGLGNLVMPWP